MSAHSFLCLRLINEDLHTHTHVILLGGGGANEPLYGFYHIKISYGQVKVK